MGEELKGSGVTPPAAKGGKTKYTVNYTSSVLERARNAVAALVDVPTEPRSIVSLLDQALYREVIRMEREYNGGMPFPDREESE